jgi:hypothetical protein
MSAPQSLKNHARFDPLFHYMIAPILLLNVVAMIWWYVRHFGEHRRIGAWAVVVSVALLMLALKSRMYALQNQDRIIALEERARLAAVVSGTELVEVSSLSIDQLVGLRFASTAELPELARRAVREKLTRKQIKEAIVSWRADNHRI